MRTNVVMLPTHPPTKPAEIAALVAEARDATMSAVRDFEERARSLALEAAEIAGLELAHVGVRETARVLAEQAEGAANRVMAMLR